MFVQWLIIGVLIFGLSVAALLVLRRYFSGRGAVATQATQRARQPRLGVIDVFDLDRQRSLVLLRRDNVEHLVMIGGPNDVVVEASIVRGASARTAPSVDAMLERALHPAETDGESDIAAALEPRMAPSEPRAEVRAEPRQPARAQRTVSPAGRFSEGTTARAEPAAPARSAPRPGDETVLNDMTRQLEEALKKPFVASPNGGAPARQDVEPAQQSPQRREAGAPAAGAPAPARAAASSPGEAPAVTVPQRQPAPAAARVQPVQAARATPSVRAEPARIEPARVEPARVEPARVEPVRVEARMERKLETRVDARIEPKLDAKPVSQAAARPEPRADVRPSAAPAVKAEPASSEAASADAPRSAPATPSASPAEAAASRPGAVPTQVAARSEPARAPQPAASQELDPFSPEAIEAEFKRLLNRLPAKSDG